MLILQASINSGNYFEAINQSRKQTYANDIRRRNQSLFLILCLFQNYSCGSVWYHYSLVANGEDVPGRANIYIPQRHTGLLRNPSGYRVFMGDVMETLYRKGK